MNIVNTLTLRCLKQNKRRTLVTIIGVIISVAMITAVATLGLSFMDLMQRNEIYSSGDWHVKYYDINASQLQAIQEDSHTQQVALNKEVGIALLPDSQNKEKPYLYVNSYDTNAFAQYPLTLTSGRLPQQPNEIILSDYIATNSGVSYAIGDTITLQFGTRQAYDKNGNPLGEYGQNDTLMLKEYDYDEYEEFVPSEQTVTYTVVGTFERLARETSNSACYYAYTYLDDTTAATVPVTASVKIKPLTRSLFDRCEQFVEEQNITDYDFNRGLLRYYGIIASDTMNQTLYTFMGILFVIIMVSSISLIYNAFAISVSERSRYLGMLSSVGATKQQKRNSVLFEGMVIGGISIPLGILFGIIGIGITLACINPLISGLIAEEAVGGFRLVVSWGSIIGAILLSILTILISTWIPARRASRATAIDAIRQTKDIKLRRRSLKTSKLTRLIYGIEGELALKNLKRNRSRYYATILSLAVSVWLFLSVSAFSMYMQKSFALTSEDIDFDLAINSSYGFSYDEEENSTAEIKQLIEALKAFDNHPLIKEQTLLLRGDFQADLQSHQYPDYIKDLDNLYDNGRTFEVTLYGVNDTTLRQLAESAGIPVEQLQNNETPAAILLNKIEFRTENGQYIQTQPMKAQNGDTISLFTYSYEENKEPQKSNPQTLSIAGTVTEPPFGTSYKGYPYQITLFVSQETYFQLIQSQQNIYPFVSFYATSDHPDELYTQMQEWRDKLTLENRPYVTNYYETRQSEMNILIFIQVFVYGFITLITLICVANIFNTISTGVILRKREFAMIQSVGMTPKSFRRMIAYESLLYGIKALLLGLPISFLSMWLMYYTLESNFSFGFTVPWISILIAIVAVFLIVGATMLYAFHKIKSESIVEAMKQENL